MVEVYVYAAHERTSIPQLPVAEIAQGHAGLPYGVFACMCGTGVEGRCRS